MNLIISDICQFRLDFDTLVLGISSNVCTDSLDIVGPTNTNGLSTLCSTLTGQHGKTQLEVCGKTLNLKSFHIQNLE